MALFLVGVPVTATVVFFNVEYLHTVEQPFKLSIVILGFFTCLYGFSSLLHVWIVEFPRLVVRLEVDNSRANIRFMRGSDVRISLQEIAALENAETESLCWYRPYSFAVDSSGTVNALRLESGARILLPYEADENDLRSELLERVKNH